MSDPVYLVELPSGYVASLTMDQINRLKEKNPNWPNPEESGKPEKVEECGKGYNPNTSVKKKKRLKKK